MSNRERLENAGILDPIKGLTNEQYEAIDSLSEAEVDQLISVNEKLAEDISTDDAVLEMPGRNPNPNPTQS